MDVLEQLKKKGLVLPPAPKPVGSYRPVIIAGNMAFLSGQVSRKPDGVMIAGKLGKDLGVEEGKAAAQVAALNALSIMHHLVGFDRFDRMLRVVGYVQAVPDFYDISSVMNGASDFFLEIFGETGAHARSAVGMASLPMNAAVEVEVTFLLKS